MSQRVVVVGAGVAGLATARLLIADGVEVTVLEARARVGGRLLSIDGLDLGASWFWPNEPRITALTQELGVAVHPQHLQGNALYQHAQGTQVIDGNPLDVPSGRFSDGADSVALALARELPPGTLHLSTPVRGVTRRVDGRLDVHTVDALAVIPPADHVVIALPPALAVDAISFDPPLDDDLAATARATPVWMAATTKVVIRYADAFWRRAGLSGAAISHVGPMRELHDMSGPGGRPAALFGFVSAGTPGQPTVTSDAVRRQLALLFGHDAPTPDRIVIHDWRTEPHTAPADVERLADLGRFGHAAYQTPAVDGRLHWASTETATAFAGHIEGALLAAERVGHTILSSTA